MITGINNPELPESEDLENTSEPDELKSISNELVNSTELKTGILGEKSLNTTKRFRNSAAALRAKWAEQQSSQPPEKSGLKKHPVPHYVEETVSEYLKGEGSIEVIDPVTGKRQILENPLQYVEPTPTRSPVSATTLAEALNRNPQLRTPISRANQLHAESLARGQKPIDTQPQNLELSDDFKEQAAKTREKWEEDRAVELEKEPPKKGERLSQHPTPKYDEASLKRHFEDGTPVRVWDENTGRYVEIPDPIRYVEPGKGRSTGDSVTPEQANQAKQVLGVDLFDREKHLIASRAFRVSTVAGPALATALAIGAGGIPTNIGPAVQNAITSIATSTSMSPVSIEAPESTEAQNEPTPKIIFRDLMVTDIFTGEEVPMKALVIDTQELKRLGLSAKDIRSIKIQVEEPNTQNHEYLNVLGVKYVGRTPKKTSGVEGSATQNPISEIEQLAKLSAEFSNQIHELVPEATADFVFFIQPASEIIPNNRPRMKIAGPDTEEQITSNHYGVTPTNSLLLNKIPDNGNLSVVITYVAPNANPQNPTEIYNNQEPKQHISAAQRQVSPHDLLTSQQLKGRIST